MKGTHTLAPMCCSWTLVIAIPYLGLSRDLASFLGAEELAEQGIVDLHADLVLASRDTVRCLVPVGSVDLSQLVRAWSLNALCGALLCRMGYPRCFRIRHTVERLNVISALSSSNRPTLAALYRRPFGRAGLHPPGR